MDSRTLDIFLPNCDRTKELGRLLAQHLSAGSVLFLEGDLGAGKTTLVKGLGEGLGISEPIVSPTFTLINEYTEGRLPLYHLDLYRLEKEQVSGVYPEVYWEGEEVTPGITAIEWSERLTYRPDTYLRVNLAYGSRGGRQVTISLLGTHHLDFDFLGCLASVEP